MRNDHALEAATCDADEVLLLASVLRRTMHRPIDARLLIPALGATGAIGALFAGVGPAQNVTGGDFEDVVSGLLVAAVAFILSATVLAKRRLLEFRIATRPNRS